MKCYTKRRLVSYNYFYKVVGDDSWNSMELEYLYSNKNAADCLKKILGVDVVVIGKSKIVRFYNIDNDTVRRYGKLLSEDVEVL